MAYQQFTANWHYPTSIRQGIGRISELPAICRELNINAPLLVTDPALAKMAMIEHAITACNEQGIKCQLFCDITSNPTGENVSAGVSAFHQNHHDGVIAFGGGSAIDAGKAIALMAGQSLPLWDFEDIGDNWRKVKPETMAPVIAIPTTSGTGSEVGRASVITDQSRHIKRIIFHPKMMPAVVILDAQLTVGLPANLTAATGMDALSHALEAYCAPGFHPMAEGIALEAMRLIKYYLRQATHHGEDVTARCQIMVASTMGAAAFQRGLGAMHALAHPLGALYNSHHGLLNAVLMPYVLKANRDAIEQRIVRLSRYLLLDDDSFDGFVNWVLALRADLGIPHKLSDIGIDDSDQLKIGQMAYADTSAGTNPIAFTPRQYSDIFERAVHGHL